MNNLNLLLSNKISLLNIILVEQMEEQLIKVLCKLIKFSYIYYTNLTNSTLLVERFLQESELVLSP